MRNECDSGMTLVEVCVAMLVMSVAAIGAAGLFDVAVRMAVQARLQTTTTVLAGQKLEELRALAIGGALGASPSGTLQSNSPGYVDFLDRHSQSLGTGTTPPPVAVFIRRWSVTTHPWFPADALVLRVLTTSVIRDRQGVLPAVRRRLADEALVTSMATRREP